MKTFSIVHILLFILLMLVYQLAKAQDYVVSAKGDTLLGSVKPLTYGNEKKVQLTADKKKTIYSLFQVRAFSYNNEIYHPVKMATGYTFMKLVKPGYLSLYAFQQPNQVSYDGLFLVKRDGASLEVPNLTFKKLMTSFLKDCETVADKIDNGDLGKRQLNDIIEAYNVCIETRTVDHSKVITRQQEQNKTVNAWDVLEEKVKSKSDFKGKEDAIEMISEIKSKIKREEKVPNFMIDGLKSSLAETDLSTELQSALNEL
jgi:hypothetical protein